MKKNQVKALLKEMYELSSGYSDQSISKSQYEHYIEMLDAANELEDLIQIVERIFCELDIVPPTIARKIAYPFSFNQEVDDWMRSQIKDGQYYCVACRCWHKYQHDDVSMALSIDHEPALSERFNNGEWKLSKKERYESYNDTSRLQIMCVRENSRKGGVRYDEEKIMKVFINEL